MFALGPVICWSHGLMEAQETIHTGTHNYRTMVVVPIADSILLPGMQVKFSPI